MKYLFLFLFISANLMALKSGAQIKESIDSVDINSEKLTEAYILYQQQQYDSIEKIRLVTDIQNASGNKKKISELEKRLRNIEAEDSLRKLELATRIEFIRQNVTASAVVPFSDTLFLIHSRIASYTAADRAANISKHIVKVYDDPFFSPDSLKITQTIEGAEITYNNDFVIMMVTNIDALYYNKEAFQLASEYLEIIKQSIVEERNTNSISNLLLRFGKVALIFAGLILLIFLINRLFRLISNLITSKREKYLKGLKINKIKLFSPENLENFLLRLNGLLRTLLIALVVYLSLPLLFSLFPETKMWTGTLLNWIINPAKQALTAFIAFLPNLFTIFVIFIIFRYTIRGIRFFVVEIEKGDIEINGFHADWAQPTFRILRFLLYAFMMVLIFPYLPGSGSPAFQGISVFIGILFSLGSSSAIANMVAGMVITYMRPFRIGDRVKIGDITGDIVEKTTLVTRIRTVKNEDVTVPNSAVLSSSTINYSTHASAPEYGLIIHTTVTIGYDVPWKEVHQALIEAALRSELILKNPMPFVLQTSLDDFYVSYQVNGYTKEANNLASIYSQLHQNIQDCFNEVGIEIMSPHYRSLRDGNMTTTPTSHLHKDYETPSFRVNGGKNY
jgi:small-conductance mechanosensitive channel